MLSEKYIAGFLDADGSIHLHCVKDTWKPQINVSFSQKSGRDEVLQLIQQRFGGILTSETIKGASYARLDIRGKLAKMMLNVIARHLVIKRHYAYALLEREQAVIGDRDQLRQWMKEQRRLRSLPLPNFPSRKWLAGYFDGDGCVSVTRITPMGAAYLVATIACADYDTEGLEIIQKNFGGVIYDMAQGRCRQWRLLAQPSKAKDFFGYFGKHSIVKRQEVEFVLGCAGMGHFRDGKNIKSALKQLKSHEHRLSESASEPAALLKTIRDLPVQRRSDYGEFVRNERGRIIGKMKRQSDAA